MRGESWLSLYDFPHKNTFLKNLQLVMIPGLKVIFRQWQDTMTGQRNFLSVKPCFWLVKILEKGYPGVNLFFLIGDSNLMYFYKETKSKIYRWGFGCLCENESVHDQSTWPTTKGFGLSSCHPGWTLSVDRRLFQALVLAVPWSLSLTLMTSTSSLLTKRDQKVNINPQAWLFITHFLTYVMQT